ncbi:hypothetical protein VY88_24920 [Azospirillum thiophilum]|uniref:Uncharacterized protein n=1 Tax=Azospirillum thiophilum TaxID=528244 RepID=A0AAC8W580_9PROT|nr:hypothetical protein [Azospirillum thiophilum]ALG75318.1 hypothetical protein AL072_30930 [Azospirillum thiophilum]KJR62233.1 hypothetical protein VY88_24920 [Azospirillum thiophilum]
MSPVEQEIRRRVIADEPIRLKDLGEHAVLAQAEALVHSRMFGDVVAALAADWADLDDPDGASALIADGLKGNPDRLVLAHAIGALAENPPPDLRRFVQALEVRSRDTSSDPLARIEAVAGLMRLALLDSRWARFALASVVMLEDVEGPWANAMLCRLAALAYEQFHDSEAVQLLEKLASGEGVSEAAFQRGMVSFGQALEGATFNAVADGLHEAARWFQTSEEAAEDRRDARLYRLLTDALSSLARHGEPPTAAVMEELRTTAVVRALWDRPRPGAKWLQPPPEAELDWILLIENMTSAVSRGRSCTGTDAAVVLADAVRLYRSIRGVMRGASSAAKPSVQAGLVLVHGMLGAVERWASGGGLPTDAAAMLQTNITTIASSLGAPPGKSLRTTWPGPATSKASCWPV